MKVAIIHCKACMKMILRMSGRAFQHHLESCVGVALSVLLSVHIETSEARMEWSLLQWKELDWNGISCWWVWLVGVWKRTKAAEECGRSG